MLWNEFRSQVFSLSLHPSFVSLVSSPQQQPQQQGVYPKRAHFFCVACCEMDLSGQASSGAAQRRKQRRLRSWWRHGQQSIAAAPGHVYAPQRTAPEDGQGRGLGTRCTPQRGGRPTPLVEVRPQILDVPVPQMRDQLVEFMNMLDTATPEQVIAVPKISQDRIPQRFVDWRRPQRAEQLVEVADRRVSFLSAAAVCRAERGHSSSWHSWFPGSWRSSRFSPKTRFISAHC